MAAKKISLKVEHAIEVGNVDVVFEVRDGNSLKGFMSISKGGIDWRGNGRRITQTATWEQFEAWMLADNAPKSVKRATKGGAE